MTLFDFLSAKKLMGFRIIFEILKRENNRMAMTQRIEDISIKNTVGSIAIFFI